MSIVSKLLAQLTGNAEMSSHFTDYMGIVSVKTHGTIGDNVTNDTVAIEAAKAAALAAGNLALYFPEGQYLVDADLDLAGYFLWGDNASFNGISDVINQVGNWMNATAESITTTLLKDKAVTTGKLADDIQVGSLTALNAFIAGAARLSVTAAINSIITALSTGAYAYAATATGNDTYVVTLDPVPSAYVEGMALNIKVDVGNTGAATLNANGKGAIALAKMTGAGVAALATGDMIANGTYTAIYTVISATPYFLVINPTSMQANIFTARGMFIRSSAANTPEAVALGATGKALTSDGTDIVYAFPESAQYVVSNNAILTANTERTTTSASYVYLKPFVVKYAGTVRVACQIKSSGGNFARLSLNGGISTIYATNETSYQNVSFDMAVTPFVTNNVGLCFDGGGGTAYIRNFEVHADISSSAFNNSITD